jgi:succinate dehydrogenase hydrophobic anchor subunit
MNLRTAPQRGFNFDYVMWLFTRLSALAMYLLALIGLVGALLMGARQNMSLADLMRWTFMPEVTHVLNTNVPNIDAWRTIFWQVMGIAVLTFASSHGLHGLLNVEEDYISNPRLRQALRLLVLVVWAVLLGIGIYVVLTS